MFFKERNYETMNIYKLNQCGSKKKNCDTIYFALYETDNILPMRQTALH